MEKKSFLVTELLCFFLGFLGVHRFYTGYIGLGILQLLTFGFCGLWQFIDLIFISLGKYQDVNGQDLEEYSQPIGISCLVIYVVLPMITGIIGTIASMVIPTLLGGSTY